MNILFTICGRAGSKGFKNKNLKEMNGIPLVFYTLASVSLYKESHVNDNVSVALNTDSEHLIDLVKNQKVLEDVKFVFRKSELAGDAIAKVDVIRDTYKTLNEQYDVVIDLDITSPLRQVNDIENIINVYNSDESFELITSVVPARRSPYFNMVEKKGQFYKKICESSYVTRQETPLSYELNASIYAYRPSFLNCEITDTILDHRCGISIMKDYLILDIDSEEDFNMMSFLHRYYLGCDEGLKQVYEKARDFLN